MSTSGQPQFRYTQTPFKVVHLRNLPWECGVVELCKPFSQVVNTKCIVGANKNQAFVEFAELSQALSSSEPAQGVEPGDVSIDVIHLVFSAFGFVHKIATFEKAAGFQVTYIFGYLVEGSFRLEPSAQTIPSDPAATLITATALEMKKRKRA